MKQIFILVLVLSSLAQAQYGAISTATAGSGHATVEPSEAPVLNPASIPYSKGYFITSDYASLYQANEFTVALTDNLPDTVVPTSFIYNQINGTGLANQTLVTQDLRLEVANLVSQDVSFGLALRSRTDSFLSYQYRQNNLLLGTIFAISPNMGIAIVADNLVGTDAKVPTAYRLLPSLAVGLNYNYLKVMRFRLDLQTASNDSFNEPTISGGMELHWNKWLLFRGGISKALETNTDEYGAGVGFEGPKFTGHLGYLMSPQQESLNREAVDLAVPIW